MTNLTNIFFSYMFIPNLYMFRALMCSSSGELYQYDVVCRFGFRVPPKPAYETVTYIKWHIPDVALIQFSWWWAHECSKLVEIWNKHIRKKSVRRSWPFTRFLMYFFLFVHFSMLQASAFGCDKPPIFVSSVAFWRIQILFTWKWRKFN
jgi:hypothetical protein